MIGARDAAARHGIAPPSPVLLDDTRAAAKIAARHHSFGSHDNVHGASLGHRQQAKPEPPAKLANPRVAFASASPRGSHSKPDFVADIRPVDALQDEIEVEGKLQFTNHDDGRAALRDSDKIATANLPFYVEAKVFQELFDRRIEARFHLVSQLNRLAAYTL